MPLSLPQFEQRLGGDTLPPAILLAGAEPLLLLEAADAVRARARTLGFAEREVHDVETGFDWDALRTSFASLSLFSARRLIELRLPTGKPGKEGGDIVAGFCANPVPDLCLLVSAAQWSRAHETAWVKSVEQAGWFVPLWPLKPNELPGWIGRRLRQRGVDAGPDAVAALVERVEGNLLAAAQEVDKLALLKPPGRLDAETMLGLVADSARYDVFRLTDTALAGDTTHALRMLAGLRGEGEQVPPMLSWIASQVQLLAQFSAVAERGGNLGQAMQQARMWDSKQGLFRRALGRGNARHFERLLADCARIDRIAKGRAGGDAWLELERLIVGIGAPRALPG
ncbi:DNA polymerase III subunit delta [Chiayiivirga flava]|uniref:DNA polymerase III subunit delta n=1 Tax=Chiayiivirga flava TaxID=659595 RepID=A0A7W8G168_9GAMM|nr:DNA polymerase-3 subunit delta [Chiayiivirga flava]